MADKQKETVGNDMKSRRTFYTERDESGEIVKTSLEAATEYLASCMERFEDFAEFPFAAPGVGTDDEGNAVFDESIYTPEMGVMVGKLNRVANKQKKIEGGVKCVFMAPIPDLAAIAMAATEDEPSRKWIRSILEKEANHVAVRPLRDADSVETVVDQMPVTLEAYTTSNRGAGAGILIAFNKLYKNLKSTLSAKVPVWAKNDRRLIKSELKMCFENAGYAREYYASLEDRGDSPSLFVVAMNLAINACKKRGYDPTIFERWLATRDQAPFTADAPADESDDFDLDSLTDDLLAEDEDTADDADDSDEDDDETDD